MDVAPEPLRQLLTFNPETGVLAWRERPLNTFASDSRGKSWNTKWAGKAAGATNNYGYTQIRILGRLRLAHKIAWAIHYGEWPKDNIDHLNGDPSDNRIKNLRVCSHSVNMQNKKRGINNSSGVMGVNWDSRAKRWKAQIRLHSKTKYLGLYESFDDAVAARKLAADALGFSSGHGR